MRCDAKKKLTCEISDSHYSKWRLLMGACELSPSAHTTNETCYNRLFRVSLFLRVSSFYRRRPLCRWKIINCSQCDVDVDDTKVFYFMQPAFIEYFRQVNVCKDFLSAGIFIVCALVPGHLVMRCALVPCIATCPLLVVPWHNIDHIMFSSSLLECVWTNLSPPPLLSLPPPHSSRSCRRPENLYTFRFIQIGYM